MVMGIKNSTTLTFTAIIPKTERINASVWPIVKATLKVQFFQSLKGNS
jgi:hypothetical protein